jgi:flagellar motility protein MotE (MotC chaperone)
MNMRILPFIIILFSIAFIFKGSSLIEKHLTGQVQYKTKKENHAVKNTERTEIEYLSEEEELPAAPEKKPAPKAKTNPYPTEDFIKECINQPPKYNDIEVKILENLSNRRKELDTREDGIAEKEKLIGIAASQVEEKLAQLKLLEESIQKLLAQYNEKEDMKIQSLVRIYQSMKPADAAKIFDELDMDILLQVINKMKESNAAPIIASMNPEKAKDLTIKIAQQKKLEENGDGK